MSAAWHSLTGEYPPQPGGVSDFTALVARGLAERGREVHVWTGGDADTPSVEVGVSVHRVAGRFGPLSLRKLSRHLNKHPAPRRLLVQYVPFAFGWKGLNVPFAAWLWWRRHWHRDDVLTMFHEVSYPWVRRPLKHNVLAAVQRVMAWLVVRASRRCHVSTPSWTPMLHRLRRRADVAWRPIPATIAGPVDAAAVVAFRATLPDGPVVAHFGTYGALIHELLTPTVSKILASDDAVTILLLGRGGEGYAAAHPEWAGRVVAAGALPADRVAVALAAADVALQPYPDGASTRRTSLMAALALGVPVVSTLGALSEPFWTETGLPLLPIDPAALAAAVNGLLKDPERRRTVGERGRALAAERFSWTTTLDALVNDETA